MAQHTGLCIAVALWLNAFGVSSAAACTVDGVPSLSLNGGLVRVNRATPSSVAVGTWAPFLAATTFSVGAQLRFVENQAQLRKVLYPETCSRPWKWRFGDGVTVVGDSPVHVYHK